MASCTISHPFPGGRLYITLVTDSSGVRAIHLDTEGREKACRSGFPKKVAEQIEEYLNGGRREFDIAVSERATDGASPFQVAVWQATKEIPYGETRTYGDIAHIIGREGAARAVGSALAKNPLPLIIPCHRVVSVSGLGGFSGGGPEVKRFLLAIEQGQML